MLPKIYDLILHREIHMISSTITTIPCTIKLCVCIRRILNKCKCNLCNVWHPHFSGALLWATARRWLVVAACVAVGPWQSGQCFPPVEHSSCISSRTDINIKSPVTLMSFFISVVFIYSVFTGMPFVFWFLTPSTCYRICILSADMLNMPIQYVL